MAKTKDENKPKMEEDTEKKSGRLGRLDEETLGYYRRVSDTMKDGFEEQEDKGKCKVIPLSPRWTT